MSWVSEAKQAGKKLALLRERHQALDDEIDESSMRRWLSPKERM